mmetsp:Transcript_56476/g.157416  ORF Transcript_56476/g.157416 Transcript_56476/m.157416 type:complete len:433 (-) Transcript_56476:209-1507(-)
MFLNSGSHRQRSRVCDIASKQLSERRRWATAERTMQALKQFEEKLEEQEQLELGADAESSIRLRSTAGDRTGQRPSSGQSDLDTARKHSRSEPSLAQGSLEDQSDSRRPPSPLGLHDYGCITLKPKSMFGQNRASPGSHTKGGASGFRIVDPALLPISPTNRRQGGSGDMRPSTTDEIGRRRSHPSRAHSASGVRTTSGHSQRTKRLHNLPDRQHEEAVLEEVCFDHGVFDGTLRSPLFDIGEIHERPEEEFEWLAKPAEEMTAEQQSVTSLLLRLDAAVQKSRGRLAQLFVDQNKGHPGILEPEEFSAGLKNLGLAEEDGDTWTPARVSKAMVVLDPAFNGRVSLPMLARAVTCARSARMLKAQDAEKSKRQRSVRLSKRYSEHLPIEVVKVENPTTSLLNFNRSFKKFVAQQRDLLELFNEELEQNGKLI